MNQQNAEQILALFQLAKEDPQYAGLKRSQAQAEREVERALQKLTKEDQDLVWDYICRAEEMNWRMLEILCARYQPGS